MNSERFSTHSLREPRVQRVLAAALEAADPAAAVRRHLTQHPLHISGRIFALAIGKAAVPMLEAFVESHPVADALAVTKHRSSPPPRGLTVIEGGHPIPDARSLDAGGRVLEFAARPSQGDLLVCLVSGGGSALVCAPHAGIGLPDLQALSAALLASGARVDEINMLRRHLDRVKGGGVLRVATRPRVLGLILSDVIGNALEAIASGPTAPDPSTRADALAVLKKYRLESLIPPSIVETLNGAPETLKPGDAGNVENVIVGDITLAARAAQLQAEAEGFSAEVLTAELQGEASQVGRRLARQLRADCANRARPFCVIAGGETTVTLQSRAALESKTGKHTDQENTSGEGKGGRNQELALAAVDELDGLKRVWLVSFATDGDDGPTDAAGAVVSGESAGRAKALGLVAAEYLSRHESYPYFDSLGDLLKTGPTGTNVNDLVFLIAD